ncbi:hypothetical protein FALBO_6905 [Fusarium albosuccineum]|uniref:Uncharacterized protein n=1 Tax=Fusarium albosuccineum TaxID=1237068 RepID=A0A8H4LCF4_9HYPO|nr:hypothetical protein FALBO_6905 [Fusarium albosuccineum]
MHVSTPAQPHHSLSPETTKPALQPLLAEDPARPVSPLSRSQTGRVSLSEQASLGLGSADSSQKKAIGTSWWLESFALILSLASFASLAYVLSAYDGRPISNWTKFPLSLNTVVSILAGVSKASLAFVISMCLSQAKWNWNRNETFSALLVDFDRFDAASRGAWGSVRLMRSLIRRPHWTSLGPFTAIILLAYEPFLQAVLTFEDQPSTLNDTEYSQMLGSATTTRSGSRAPEIGSSLLLDAGSWTGYSASNGLIQINFPGPNGEKFFYQSDQPSSMIRDDMATAAAIWNGFSPYVSQQNLWPDFTCTTGNCSWANFASLGVCSSCYDLSGHLKRTSGSTKIPDVSMPGGFQGDPPDISNQGVEANVNVAGERLPITKYEVPDIDLMLSNYNGRKRCKSDKDMCPDTYLSVKVTTNPGQIVFNDIDTMIVSISFLQTNKSWVENETAWEDTSITAQQCSLHFCVNEYVTAVKQGLLEEKIVSSWSKRTPRSYYSDSQDVPEYFDYLNHTLDMGIAWVDLTDLQLFIPDEDYKRAHNLSHQTFNITQPSVMSVLNTIKAGFREPDCRSNCSLDDTDGTKFLIYPSLGGPSRPPGLMVGLGESNNVSATMENVALSLTKWMRDRESGAVHGKATTIIVITRVQWKFLVYPAVTLVIGFIFALLSMWETKRLKRPAWKDSALATLAYADGELKDRIRAAAAVGQISEVGRLTRVASDHEDDVAIGHLVVTENQERRAI